MSIDRDQIAKSLGFQRSDIDMLLGLFINNAAVSIKEMQAMIKENNFAGIADAAHAVKGSAGNLKLDEIYAISKTIESAAKNSESVDYNTLCKQLTVLVESV